VLTGSRDKTIKLWSEGPDGNFTATTTLVGGLRGGGGRQQLAMCCRQRRRQRSCHARPAAAIHPIAVPSTPLQVGHTDFVSALAYAAPGVLQGCPNGAVVSGSRDTTVRVWHPQTAEVLQTLEGHQYQVGGLVADEWAVGRNEIIRRRRCCFPLLLPRRLPSPQPLARLPPPSAPLLQVSAVVVTPDGDIVSASLDKTIRVWRGGQCVQVLEGHEAAVLCLLQLPNGDLLSGSGDSTIKVWSGGKCTHTIAAHTDSVRWVLGQVPGRRERGEGGQEAQLRQLIVGRLAGCGTCLLRLAVHTSHLTPPTCPASPPAAYHCLHQQGPGAAAQCGCGVCLTRPALEGMDFQRRMHR
jgi:WD40 repeat protein